MDAEDAELANLPPEEAARKLASQNRLLRTKLRAVYRAEEENAKLRAQVENLAQQLVRRMSRSRVRVRVSIRVHAASELLSGCV